MKTVLTRRRRIRQLYEDAADAYREGILYQSGAKPNHCAWTYRDDLRIAHHAGCQAVKDGTVSNDRRLPLDVWQAVFAEHMFLWSHR